MRPRFRVPVLARLVAALALLAALTVLAVAAAPAGARSGGGGSGGSGNGQPDQTTDDTPVPSQRIIPLPNTGVKPTDAGDRGGALQILVFVAIVGGVSTIVALAVRDARRARRRAAAGGGQPSSGP